MSIDEIDDKYLLYNYHLLFVWTEYSAMEPAFLLHQFLLRLKCVTCVALDITYLSLRGNFSRQKFLICRSLVLLSALYTVNDSYAQFSLR